MHICFTIHKRHWHTLELTFKIYDLQVNIRARPFEKIDLKGNDGDGGALSTVGCVYGGRVQKGDCV